VEKFGGESVRSTLRPVGTGKPRVV